MKRVRSQRCVIAIALVSLLLAGADWPRFLGPDASVVSDDKAAPSTWSEKENVAWKTPMPGPGGSSPIVLGTKVFLTAYSGYGIDQDKSGAQEELKHHLLCIDSAGGKILWDKTTKASLPEQDYQGFLALHGYASGTPATDGKAVYAFFGRSGVLAYSLAGEQLWKANVGDKVHGWGTAASPILAGELLIVNASVESGSLVALNKSSGQKVWEVEGIRDSWSTPVLLSLAGGKQELVVSSHSKVLGLDPATGKQLWECAGVPDYVCPSVVAHGDVVYVAGGRKPATMAIRGGGRGDVTKSHKLWEISKAPKVPTPLYYNGLLHWVSDNGAVCCVKADDGKVLYEERLKGFGRVYASMIAAGERLYVVGRDKGALVLAAGEKFQELARNDLGDRSIFNGTPLPIGEGRILLRSDKFLYCLGK